MPTHKKQHYLPSSYLKYFATESLRNGRRSKTWRCDGKRQILVAVDSQCHKDYFYSKANPQKAEESFAKLESVYCRIVDKLIVGNTVSPTDLGSLFLCMVDLNLRNAIHVNRTENEGFEVYESRCRLFIQQMFLNEDQIDNPRQEMMRQIFENWRIDFIHAPKDVEFATSDNPSVFLTYNETARSPRRATQAILLALTPKLLVVVFDKRVIAVNHRHASLDDVIAFNNIQLLNAKDCLFIPKPLEEAALEYVAHFFSTRQTPVCEIDDDKWRSFIIYVPPEYRPSLMVKNPPLF